MKRIFDIILSATLIIFLITPMIIIYLIVILTSPGGGIHWSKRIGKNNKTFLMPKFRTMIISTPQVATHRMKNPKENMTPAGHIIRKASLDELPQLFTVLTGKMSLVGPRPALFNQHDLIELRKRYKIDELKPGITGYAQINGRDLLSIEEKVKFEKIYCEKISLFFDFKIILKTVYYLTRLRYIKH